MLRANQLPAMGIAMPVVRNSFRAFIGALLPIMVGVIAASLYAQFAGREMLQGAPGRSADDAAPSAPKPPVTFDGPVQVRTSVVATLIASTIPAATVALIIAPFAGML